MESLRKIRKRINREELPPVIKVSVRPGYDNTLLDLVQLTKNNVANVVDQIDISQATTSRKGAPAPIQQRNCLDNLLYRAESGRQYVCRSKYRDRQREVQEVLGSELPLSEQALDRCLDTIHEDIALV